MNYYDLLPCQENVKMIICYAMAIADRINSVHEKIIRAAKKSSTNPDKIKLIAVSKTVNVQSITNALYGGVKILGENKVQEARTKISELRSQNADWDIKWHLIGHLQKNKAKTAVQLFDLIQTVDSRDLAEELNRQAEKFDKIQRILVQVKLADEETKHGMTESDLMTVLEKVTALDYLKLEGLMTIPPFFDDPEEARPYYRKLRELAASARKQGFSMDELSMGMSNDYEVAIEEGATMIRVGTAIFGERDYRE